MYAVFVSLGDPTDAQLQEEARLRARLRSLMTRIRKASGLPRATQTRLREEARQIEATLDEAVLAVDEMAAAMALDDAGHLRRCIVCGCPNLYCEKAFPQVTGFVVVLAFAGAIVGALGLATPPLLIAMGVVLVLDVAILLFSRRRLVCYRCASSFHGAPIAGYHKGWDRTMAERHGRAASEAGSPDR